MNVFFFFFSNIKTLLTLMGTNSHCERSVVSCNTLRNIEVKTKYIVVRNGWFASRFATLFPSLPININWTSWNFFLHFVTSQTNYITFWLSPSMIIFLCPLLHQQCCIVIIIVRNSHSNAFSTFSPKSLSCFLIRSIHITYYSTCLTMNICIYERAIKIAFIYPSAKLL